MSRILEAFRAGGTAAVNDLVPYARTVGFEIAEDESGLLTIARARPENVGNTQIPSLHGGVVGALMEHAAFLHLLNDPRMIGVPKIVNLSVDYLRPCLVKDTFARGRVIKQGRKVANVRVEAWQDDPTRPVAAAHAHFLLS